MTNFNELLTKMSNNEITMTTDKTQNSRLN